MRATAKTWTGAPAARASSAAFCTAAFEIGLPSVARSTPPWGAVAVGLLMVRRRGMREGEWGRRPCRRPSVWLCAVGRDSRGRLRCLRPFVFDALPVPVEREIRGEGDEPDDVVDEGVAPCERARARSVDGTTVEGDD